MGVIETLLQKRAGWSASDERWWHEIGWSEQSYTGARVTSDSALRSVAVFACIRILSETLASLPLPLYRRLGAHNKERATDHPLYSLLHDAPNEEMTSFAFRETLMQHVALWGNAYAEIDWNMASGRPRALWPLKPSNMVVKRRNGKLLYEYTLPDGALAVLPAYRIFHVPGLGFDGLVGYSPIHMAREAIGLSLATEEYGARFFGNGAKPGGVLEHPAKLSKQAQDNLRESWSQMHQGLSNQHRIAILEEGMKYQQVGIPPDDAQFLDTRKFQRAEIASFFHIPPHMIGDLEHATFSNIEHQGIEFVVYTMRPWLVRWEQVVHKKLLGERERETYFAEFLVDGLLRGDAASRYQAYATARQWGWMSANDVRRLENLNPLPGREGDIYYVPMNMLPAGTPPAPKEAKAIELAGLSPTEGRSALNRHRIANSYRRVFEDASSRIVKRERDNILRAAKKHLSERSVKDWDSWLEDFYRDFPDYIGRQIMPAVRALAEAIEPVASDEVHGEPGMTPELESFLTEYVTAFNARYVQSSKGQLKSIVVAAEEGQDLVELVDGRLTEWEQKRPGKVGLNETVQLSNAVAKVVFIGAGVTLLRWQAIGGESCPLCQEMDGRVVGVEKPFLAKDDTLKAEGGSEIKAYHPTTHPPLHPGCVCQIVPG